MKHLITIVIILLILPIAFGDLSSYPDEFTSGNTVTVVVGDSAPSSDVLAALDVVTGIQQQMIGINIISKISSEVSSTEGIISVGNACNNPISKQILQVSDADCKKGLLINRGVIELKDDVLVVYGYGNDEIRLAASLLKEYTDHALTGSRIEVCGRKDRPRICTGNDPKIVPASAVKTIKVKKELVTDNTTITGNSNSKGTCTDIIQNQGEEAIDCGGPCEPCTTCNGCEVGAECVPIGKQAFTSEGRVYCDKEKQLKPQKEDKELCDGNYECLSGGCNDYTCGEKEENKNLLSRFWSWFKGLFN